MKECQLCKTCYNDDVAACSTDGMPTVHTIPGDSLLEGKYQLDVRLGQGGMGVVYKARHIFLKTQLAIKIILPDLVGNDPHLITRFRQEALAAAAIRHQNVVGVTDYGVIQGTVPYLVMEYVDGESLHDLLTREKRLSPARAFELISAIASGVGAAHKQGIVHRDLKPLNIMIARGVTDMSQAVKILDFGLAKIKSGELLGSFIQAQTTGLMGSPYYMAPEQWADEDPDSRADIYSLGVMLFQMLTGDVPFKGSSIPAIMKKHLSDPPPTFGEMGVSFAPAVEEAVRHTLQKDPKERTDTIEELILEFGRAIGIVPNQTSGLVSTIKPPAATLNIITSPPLAEILINDVSVGRSNESGLLMVEGLQSGRHSIKVRHQDHGDWLGSVDYDGRPHQVVADLTGMQNSGMLSGVSSANVGATSQYNNSAVGINNFETRMISSDQVLESSSASTPKKGFFTMPVLLGIGIVGLLALGIIGTIGAAATGMVDVASLLGRGEQATPTPTQTPGQQTPPDSKPVSAQIPGGSFSMGRDAGRENEKPAHEATVSSFVMDKTEVTNGEYLAFVQEMAYQPLPSHWVNSKPISGEENMPVRFVNIDDINAFIEWRSKRDGVKYRLPTEAEWEYAARNGAKEDLYPWGNEFDPKCAAIDETDNTPRAVGSKSCPNQWGIEDLIGNVFEWTSTENALYPGNPGKIIPLKERYNIVRGGSTLQKSSGTLAITATFRQPIEVSRRSPELGFRLVRSE